MIEVPPNPSQNTPALAAQRLVAVTGIFPTRAPSEIELAGSEKLTERIGARVRRFLRASEPADMKWREPPGQKHLHDKLTDQLDPMDVGEWFATDPSMAMIYSKTIEDARGFLLAHWPVYPDPRLGVNNYELGPDEYAALWQLCETLDHPETLFDDLDSLMLLPDQVDAVAFVYPDLYQQINEITALALADGYIDAPGEPRRHELSAEREDLIRTLLRLPPEAVIEIPVPPQSQPSAQGKTTPTQTAKHRDELRTPADRSAAQQAG
jgi:hypothetical protein